MRPRYLDRLGIDRFDVPVISFLLACALAAFVVCGCNIPMPPVPVPPTPEPTPIVVTTEATLLVIEESADRTPETATVLGDVAFWSGLGVKWRFIDDDSPEAVAYLSMVTERPGLVVLDKAGKKTWGGPLPRTTDEIKRLVK